MVETDFYSDFGPEDLAAVPPAPNVKPVKVIADVVPKTTKPKKPKASTSPATTEAPFVLETKPDGRRLSTQIERAMEVEAIKDVQVETIMSDITLRSRAETKAWAALDTKLSTRYATCGKCHGSGAYKENPDGCPACGGTGKVEIEPDMKAVDLVLSPKFPKTTINLNARIDDMETKDIISMVLGM